MSSCPLNAPSRNRFKLLHQHTVMYQAKRNSDRVWLCNLELGVHFSLFGPWVRLWECPIQLCGLSCCTWKSYQSNEVHGLGWPTLLIRRCRRNGWGRRACVLLVLCACRFNPSLISFLVLSVVPCLILLAPTMHDGERETADYLSLLLTGFTPHPVYY